jgi:hypothetical protein
MATVFAILASISTGLLLLSAGLGSGSHSNHLMVGLFAGVLSISCHCLIFGIFTGSGKDTRLLVEDWRLDPQFVKQTKVFKRTIFPPALYAILFTLMTTTLGGALSSSGAVWMHWAHGLLAVFTIVYNIKTFYIEFKAIQENARILREVNKVAANVTSNLPQEKEQFEEGVGEKVADLDWGTHVFAFGRFLCFMGWNVWLAYIYFRWIMGEFRTPLWPFFLSSLLLLGFGYLLRFRYRSFRPEIHSGA